MAGYGREDVRRSRLSGSPGGDYLTAGMHDAAVADGSKQHGHRQVNAENACTQICIRNRHRLARPKCDRVEGAPILLQSEFAFGTAVNVIKDYFRNAAAGQRPQMFTAGGEATARVLAVIWPSSSAALSHRDIHPPSTMSTWPWT